MNTRRGFTIIELLVTLGVIGLLVGIILPALGIVRGNAALTKSTSNMRQIFSLMQNYSTANRDHIVPSLFDRTSAAIQVKGKPRSDSVVQGSLYRGTWSDILWTDAGFGPISYLTSNGSENSGYRTDSPDGGVYEFVPNFERGPFRSAVPMKKQFTGNVSADPDINSNSFGSRTIFVAEPGMFAANNFFDGRSATKRAFTNHKYDARAELSGANETFFTNGQIVRPESSAYLVDSICCETIDPVEGGTIEPFDATDTEDVQIDFRYPGDTCAILLLDGHARIEQRWETLTDLEGSANDLKDDGSMKATSNADKKDQGRGIRFRHLDLR